MFICNLMLSIHVPPSVSINLLFPLEWASPSGLRVAGWTPTPSVCIILLATQMGMWLKSDSRKELWSVHSNY